MENLAYLQSATAYEDPGPPPTLNPLEGCLPNAVQLGAAAGAIAFSVTSLTPMAQAVVRLGDNCPEVLEIQNALIQRGYLTGAATGTFDENTRQAVIRLQTEFRLNATGEVDNQTATVLELNNANDPNGVFGPNQSCTNNSGGNDGGNNGGGNDGGNNGGGVNPGTTTSAKVIAQMGVNVRRQPTTSSPRIGTRSFGQTVVINDQRVRADGYTWAQLADQSGWLVTSALSMGGGSGGSGGSSTNAVVIAGMGVNVRSGPSLSNRIIATRSFGQTVSINGQRVRADGYTWAQLADQSGWLVTSALSIGGSGGNGGGGGVTQARVIASIGANVRIAPGFTRVIGGKAFGQTVQLTSERVRASGYTWAKLANQSGWMATSTLSIGSSGGGGGTAGRVTVSTNGSGLNARVGPGLGFAIAAAYSNGTVLQTSGRVSNGWIQLTNGLWVSGTWVI